MAELMPHYKGRMPNQWLVPKNNSVAETEVPHPYAANFPAGYNPSDGDDQTLAPLSGIIGPILDATAITVAAPGVAPIAGKYTPANAVAPANLTEMNALSTASGDDFGQTTTWTVGQYIVLGNGEHCHWVTADAWYTGDAPA